MILGSWQTTGALWRDESVIDAGTISAGTLDIKVGATGSEVDSYVMDSLGGLSLGPGAFSQQPLSVRNAGTVPMQYRLQSASATTPLGPSLVIRVDQVASADSCPIAAPPSSPTELLYSGPVSAAQGPAAPAFRALAVGASEVLCFRVTLSSSPPQNSSSKVTFTFLAEQL